MVLRLKARLRRHRWLAVALDTSDRVSALRGDAAAASVALTAFTSLFPMILLALAVVGLVGVRRPNLAADTAAQLGLGGTAIGELISEAITNAGEHTKSSSIVGVVGLLWTGSGLAGSIGLACDLPWQVAGRGLKDRLYGLGWLVGGGLLVVLSVAATALLNVLPGWMAPLNLLVGLGVDIALWWWTLRVLTHVDVGWRPLLPGAIVWGVGFKTLEAVGTIAVPRLVAGSALYGSIGSVFALLAWMVLLGKLVVFAATVNVILWERTHGTDVATVELPRRPGAIPLRVTRGGTQADVQPVLPDSSTS